jgi:hypothetical protein
VSPVVVSAGCKGWSCRDSRSRGLKDNGLHFQGTAGRGRGSGGRGTGELGDQRTLGRVEKLLGWSGLKRPLGE